MKQILTAILLIFTSISSYAQCGCGQQKSFYSQNGKKESISMTTELYQDKDSTLYSKYIDYYGRYLIIKYDEKGNPHKHYLKTKKNKTKYQQLKM